MYTEPNVPDYDDYVAYGLEADEDHRDRDKPYEEGSNNPSPSSFNGILSTNDFLVSTWYPCSGRNRPITIHFISQPASASSSQHTSNNETSTTSTKPTKKLPASIIQLTDLEKEKLSKYYRKQKKKEAKKSLSPKKKSKDKRRKHKMKHVTNKHIGSQDSSTTTTTTNTTTSSDTDTTRTIGKKNAESTIVNNEKHNHGIKIKISGNKVVSNSMGIAVHNKWDLLKENQEDMDYDESEEYKPKHKKERKKKKDKNRKKGREETARSSDSSPNTTSTTTESDPSSTTTTTTNNNSSNCLLYKSHEEHMLIVDEVHSKIRSLSTDIHLKPDPIDNSKKKIKKYRTVGIRTIQSPTVSAITKKTNVLNIRQYRNLNQTHPRSILLSDFLPNTSNDNEIVPTPAATADPAPVAATISTSTAIAKRSPDEPILKGLKNKTNWCYMISSVQALFTLKQFLDYILSVKVNNGLVQKYQELVDSRISFTNNKNIEFNLAFEHFHHYFVKNVHTDFDNADQHDANEFLIKFISEITSEDPDINKYFEINYFEDLRCTRCEQVHRRRSDKSYMLNLNVPSKDDLLKFTDPKRDRLSLSECINYWQKEDHCKFCDSKEAIIEHKLLNTPEFILLTLKRYERLGTRDKFGNNRERVGSFRSSRHNINKIETKIIPNYYLKFTYFQDNNIDVESDEEYEEELTYELKGIIKHIGTRVNTGHYVAVVNHADSWYEFSDEVIKPIIDINEIADGYIFVYQLVEEKD